MDNEKQPDPLIEQVNAATAEGIAKAQSAKSAACVRTCLICCDPLTERQHVAVIAAHDGCVLATICERCSGSLGEAQREAYLRAASAATEHERFRRDQERHRALSTIEACHQEITKLYLEKEKLEAARIDLETARTVVCEQRDAAVKENEQYRQWITILGFASVEIAAAWLIFG